MLTIIKVFISYSYSASGNREHPVNFQSKSVYKLSVQLRFQIYCVLAQTEGERDLFWKGAKRGTTLQYYHLADISKR